MYFDVLFRLRGERIIDSAMRCPCAVGSDGSAVLDIGDNTDSFGIFN